MTRRIFRSQVTWQFSVISLVKSSRPDHIVMLCHNAARHRKRLFIDHSFCVRISYYCNNVEYTWISLKVVEFRSLYYILYHSLCNIKWNFLIVTVTISLDDIMDNGDEHTYPPSHATIDSNQLNMMENMFQAQMLEMERAVQQQLAAERASWTQENRTWEADWGVTATVIWYTITPKSQAKMCLCIKSVNSNIWLST